MTRVAPLLLLPKSAKGGHGMSWKRHDRRLDAVGNRRRGGGANSADRPAQADHQSWHLVSQADYRVEAVRAHQGGVVVFPLAIGADGRVTACSIVTGSGFPSLDTQTCGLLVRGRGSSLARAMRSGAILAGFAGRFRPPAAPTPLTAVEVSDYSMERTGSSDLEVDIGDIITNAAGFLDSIKISRLLKIWASFPPLVRVTRDRACATVTR